MSEQGDPAAPRGPAGPPPILSGAFRIDREGTWRHEGQEVTHPGVLRNLFANLRVEGDRHYLAIGPSRIPVEVEDAPFVVLRVELSVRQGDSLPNLRIYLSDGSQEILQPETLWLGPRGTPYCRVKGGRFRARFALPAWLQLAEFLREDAETGQLELHVGGRRVALRGQTASGAFPPSPGSR